MCSFGKSFIVALGATTTLLCIIAGGFYHLPSVLCEVSVFLCHSSMHLFGGGGIFIGSQAICFALLSVP